MSSPTSTSTPATIGLLLGSLRQGGNNAGLATWFTTIAQRTLSSTNSTATPYTIQQIFPFPTSTATSSTSPARYPGPVIDAHMPQAIQSSADYPSTTIQHWSNTVRSCVAFVVLTPQYNWSVPGELKNAIDHLYHEWTNKPVLIVTYGGHGGGRCGEHLRVIASGGLKMRVVENKVEIVLPRPYIAGVTRVGDGGEDSFLEQYEATLTKAVEALADMLQPADGVAETAVKI